ncbi:hypothetical protein L195_g051980 [Trifolium pratense]|uniref:Cysteine-rich receptor-like protein kinase n=1 Tax=Trifolium pratense TaxID=57577 RepID=A0A2K3K2N7_TRIPR|nr:hypothetical protein L195_g051980 [Trifolium pratense]
MLPMKIMSLNLRGWGNTAKRRRLSSLLKSDVEWVVKESIGLSGGLLSIWNKELFSFHMSGKRKLWKDLVDFKLNIAKGDWCLGGDFNAILKLGERKGSSGGGARWRAMSRLDRFLLSEGFIEKGGIFNQWIGDRDISDHCPIWLVCTNLD